MSTQEAIETISSVLGILSFLGFGISITSLLKKNLFLTSRVLPYELNESSLLLKKLFQ